MARPLPESDLTEAVESLRPFLGESSIIAKAAKSLGMNRQTLWHRLRRAALAGVEVEGVTNPVQATLYPSRGELHVPSPSVVGPGEPELVVDSPPEEIDVEELIQERVKKFERKAAREEALSLIPVQVRMDGPIGVLFFGDPHVDDDGTDIKALFDHAALVAETPGLYAANVGDTTNNWVGRMARLYGEQSTSAQEAWAIAERWVRSVADWLFIVAGNHDLWSGPGDPLQWIAAQSGTLYESSQVRMELRFPNGKRLTLNCRHDFAGRSMWNPAHGSMKAAQMGFRDHVLVNGHTHVSGYGVVKDPATGVISHCIQVASYKRWDRYAKEKGFPDQHISPCAVAVLDPYADDVGAVQVFWDPEVGADFLTWKRASRASK